MSRIYSESSLVFFLGGEERFEALSAYLLAHSDSGICNGKHHVLPGSSPLSAGFELFCLRSPSSTCTYYPLTLYKMPHSLKINQQKNIRKKTPWSSFVVISLFFPARLAIRRYILIDFPCITGKHLYLPKEGSRNSAREESPAQLWTQNQQRNTRPDRLQRWIP